MIVIQGIKVPIEKPHTYLEQQIMKKLHLKYVPDYEILKRSIDARKKSNIQYIYQVGILLSKEEQLVKKLNDKNIMLTNKPIYQFPLCGEKKLINHPLIIGSGPAGLFCGLILAKAGYEPIIVERGLPVDERKELVEAFFQGEPLDIECNVQFGEGGAGTFSDGKLNTQVKDKYGRIGYVLETFVRHGADSDILYDNKPHVGTDRLVSVIRGIREEIESLGGVFYFQTKAVDFRIENQEIKAVKLLQNKEEVWISTNQVILAIGHSARDTFSVLYDRCIPMRAKEFAMGVRIEHPREWIQKAMYGDGEAAKRLPAAPYKLTHQLADGRGVYSFCMCPGGYVVNASSEEGRTAVNGMSYSGRSGKNSNSAIVVSVKQSDFPSNHPLAGVELQRQLEENIYKQGKGKILVQRFEDFRNKIPTTKLGVVTPQMKGEYRLGDVSHCLPDFIRDGIVEGVLHFEQSIKGFSHSDALISGVESRTSSPVRIDRDVDFESEIRGLYPCGEGAGYAGGIMSAAMDGMKVAEAIIKKYMPKR